MTHADDWFLASEERGNGSSSIDAHHGSMAWTEGNSIIALVGGIDLCHGRRDDARHHGDRQAVKLDARYGDRPPWHDVQLEVRGPAVADLELTFRERWSDPSALNYSGAVRALFSRAASL